MSLVRSFKSLDYFYSSTILNENREEFILRNMVVGYISEQFTNWLISNSKNWFDIACKIVFNKNRIPVISMYHSFSPSSFFFRFDYISFTLYPGLPFNR